MIERQQCKLKCRKNKLDRVTNFSSRQKLYAHQLETIIKKRNKINGRLKHTITCCQFFFALVLLCCCCLLWNVIDFALGHLNCLLFYSFIQLKVHLFITTQSVYSHIIWWAYHLGSFIWNFVSFFKNEWMNILCFFSSTHRVDTDNV